MTIVAAIQMCSTPHVEENLAAARELISLAAQQQADLVVLPENFAIMGRNDTDKLAVQETFGTGKIQTFLASVARERGVWLLGGTIPIAEEDSKRVRAASLVFNAHGECVARYDKIHLFDVTLSDAESYHESATIEPGSSLTIVETPFGKLGLGVCYDIRFPELFRSLFNQGAEILAIPAAFTVKTGEAHWEVLTRSRAIENFCYVIGAAQGGTHASGRKTYGNSVIIAPWGNVVATLAGTQSGVIIAEIDLQKQRELRKALPVAQHQKIFFDLAKLSL